MHYAVAVTEGSRSLISRRNGGEIPRVTGERMYFILFENPNYPGIFLSGEDFDQLYEFMEPEVGNSFRAIAARH